MAEVRSIFSYVDKKCYNGLYDAAAEYIAKHWETMGLESRRVPDIQTAELADAWVRRVYVSDLPGDRIAFDVGLEVQIAVSSADHHNDFSDELTEWLRISCEGDLAQGLNDWTITNTCIYRKQNFPENSMSDALVPDIRNDKMDDAATAFLREYYPEALRITKPKEPPVFVDPMVLAKRLGLQVVTRPIREDGAVFGQLFFDDADTEMYDSNQNEIVPVHIPGKTIIVDPTMFLLTNYGSPGNTIIHECVHWAKHRKVYMLEKLYNDKARGITCEVTGGVQADLSRRATERMESQANRLAPRIQMPVAPFKAKANDYISRFMREMGARHEIEVMEAVIQQLATDFVVSRQSVKIRLVELGFEAAIGTFTYIDDHYVKPYSFRKGAIRVDQTFSISAQDAAILFDDVHTASAWSILEKFTSIPVEHITIERIKQNKSLVDIRLTARACQEHYENKIDSFIIVSSDSDYWGLISSLPRARFLVMIEREKCGPDMKAALTDSGIFYCYLDDFYSGDSEELKMNALFREMRIYMEQAVKLNVNAMLDDALRVTRITMPSSERKQFYDKYIKTLQLVINEAGDVSLAIKVK